MRAIVARAHEHMGTVVELDRRRSPAKAGRYGVNFFTAFASTFPFACENMY